MIFVDLYAEAFDVVVTEAAVPEEAWRICNNKEPCCCMYSALKTLLNYTFKVPVWSRYLDPLIL